MNINLYCVIMAGGQGTRLWPLSRKNLPKQLIPFYNNSTLLDLTVKRIEKLTNATHRWVITTEAYKDIIQHQLGSAIGTVLAEPATQNTGPALLYTCIQLYKQDPSATVIFIPADHYIEQHDLFVTELTKAVNYATAHNTITLLGLRPTSAATGYGYIEYNQDSSQGPYKVTQFHEKPDTKTAESYIQQSNMLWNIGIFCGPVSVFIEQFKMYAPELTTQVDQYLQGKRSYTAITNISIDHAIMEHSTNIYVQPVNFSWSDVGNITTFIDLAHQQNSHPLVTINAHNNSIYSTIPSEHKKIIALIGIDNICIVDTPDALLIVHKQDVERIKELHKELALRNLQNYL